MSTSQLPEQHPSGTHKHQVGLLKSHSYFYQYHNLIACNVLLPISLFRPNHSPVPINDHIVFRSCGSYTLMADCWCKLSSSFHIHNYTIFKKGIFCVPREPNRCFRSPKLHIDGTQRPRVCAHIKCCDLQRLLFSLSNSTQRTIIEPL